MITGTFLDEITHDIPYQNWNEEQWDQDFQAMKSIGIDTVILIRAGYRDRATFESQSLRKIHPALLVDFDLVDLFLRLSERHEMSFYFGTYDSGEYWHRGHYEKEADINRGFLDEVWERYGHSPAFAGWYLSHEINAFDDGMMKVYRSLAYHMKTLKDLPILISPYIRGIKQFDDPISLEEHEKEWDQVFANISGLVDIVAFQDGHVDYPVLQEYLTVNAELARRYGIASWSNVETFDRDMPIDFPPIGWPKLKFKIETARAAGVDKLITFEFSHFMSPNSCYPAAHNLYRRYCQHFIAPLEVAEK